jgi:(1->4)-alpha-D-glucan 1-alpha-D-glucosylmutase
MSIPRATARLQLHAGFTLNDARDQASYYAAMGVSHLYLSPISTARTGSTHGYDVVNHEIVNPELGGEPALIDLSREARALGMGLVLDIVPNHMATHADNAWWWDVLERGPESAYAEWFDIRWNTPHAGLRGKVLAPFLAEPYGETLSKGDIKLVWDEAAARFHIDACGARYPVAPDTLPLLNDGSQFRGAFAAVDLINGEQQRLHELLERQHYRLAWWRCAADSLNWRRFFEISDLIGMRIEEGAVFDAVHALPLRLFSEGWVDGLRIDHVDGLAYPLAYCRRLRDGLAERSGQRPGQLRGDEGWLIVEKILAHDETLDERWAVHGASGYDFMDQAGAVLHDIAAEPVLTEHWNDIARSSDTPAEVLEGARRLMLERHFIAERSALLDSLERLAQCRPATRDLSRAAIARALDAVLRVFPVYRTYVENGVPDTQDARRLASVLREARRSLERQRDCAAMAALSTLHQWLEGGVSTEMGMGQELAELAKRDYVAAFQALRQSAITRFQQLTPPLAAKSLEDTVFYRYGRLLSRNEVGSDPGIFATSAEDFHRRNEWRARHARRGMLTTATHDHKRGEDVRARLATLTEMAPIFAQASARWLDWPGLPPPGDGIEAADRYMLLQTLIGAWPLTLTLGDRQGLDQYAERLIEWQTKALREAKRRSSWFDPNIPYENQCADYVRALVASPQAATASTRLLQELEGFVQRIAPAGVMNSLTQLVLRMTSPGVPDLYQGAELWDFSLVDPDNRRPVDYARRAEYLQALKASGPDNDMVRLLMEWRSGRIKQAIVFRCLRFLQARPALFAAGAYIGLPVVGPKSAHVIAYLRTLDDAYAIVLTTRLSLQAVTGQSQGAPMIASAFWGDTGVVLPPDWIPGTWVDVLGGRTHRLKSGGVLRLSDALAPLPTAILTPELAAPRF